MKTWRIMLISDNAQQISWKQATQRYFAAILSWLVLGMGFLLSLLDDRKRCWHDMLSGSYLVQLEKPKK